MVAEDVTKSPKYLGVSDDTQIEMTKVVEQITTAFVLSLFQ